MRTRITIAEKEIGVFDDVKIGMGLAMQLEDETGWTVPELIEQVGRGSGRALQALVWFTQVQSGNPRPDRHLEFTFDDIKLHDLDAEEAGAGKDSGPVKAVKAA